MNKTKIAINGFGRIGRPSFKIAMENPEIEVVAINDLGELDNLAYLLKYDSAYGCYAAELKVKSEKLKVGKSESVGMLNVNGKDIFMFSEKDPAKLPWGELEVDVVLECTGMFVDRQGCQGHLDAGAKKVIISAPTKDESVKTVVIGCNEKEITVKDDILSMASCTTNCIAPMIKVIEDNFGVEKSLMSTIHSYTSTQMLVDGPGGKKDMRRGRAAAQNIVPSTTGAAIAATKTLPTLKGKFDGMAFRVPTLVGSISDIVIMTEKETSKEEINSALEEAAQKELKGIMQVTDEALVSHDIVGNPHSCVVQTELTNVVGGNLIKIIGWYDNEWGYSNRLVELAVHITHNS